MTKYCSSCGAQIPADTVFCPNCGAKQPVVASPQPAAQTSQPQPAAQPQATAQPQAAAQTQYTAPQPQAVPDIRAAMANAAETKAKPGDPNWVPYNQYPEHGFGNGWRTAYMDAFNFKQAVGRANYWWGQLYVLPLIVALIPLGTAGEIIGNLVSLSLDVRRMMDFMTNSNLRMVLIVFDVAATMSTAVNPFVFIVSLAITLYVGLSKTDWRSSAERPVAPLA